MRFVGNLVFVGGLVFLKFCQKKMKFNKEREKEHVGDLDNNALKKTHNSFKLANKIIHIIFFF